MLARRFTSSVLYHQTALLPSLKPKPTTLGRFFTMTSPSSEQITPDYLSSKLQSKLQTTHVSVEDISGGCGQSFNAVVVSPEFEKKTLLARTRLVNSVLKDEIAAIHAWTPRCLTPEQWEKEKEKLAMQ